MEPDDQDPTRRFSDRAEDYARHRPGYPLAAVDAVLQGLGPPAQLLAADVGAGTGISARLLAERGVRVHAVEPNAAMRAAAAAHPRVLWIDGTAEATGLESGAYDLILVAQAFHWFDRERALAEFHRVLRRGGRLAVVWNRRSRDDPFTVGYRDALTAIDGEAPAERSEFDPATVVASGKFGNGRVRSFANSQTLSLDDLIGRALSTSTVPKSGPRLQQLLGMLRELHARHRDGAGRVVLVYRADVFSWDRADVAT